MDIEVIEGIEVSQGDLLEKNIEDEYHILSKDYQGEVGARTWLNEFFAGGFMPTIFIACGPPDCTGKIVIAPLTQNSYIMALAAGFWDN